MFFKYHRNKEESEQMCSKVFIYLLKPIVADKKEYLRGDTDIYNQRRKGSQIVTDIRRRRKRLVNIRNYLFV